MAQVEANQQHARRGRQPIGQAKAQVFGQRQQQQIEQGQRHPHQHVLHRVHAKVLQYLEQEETREGQGDEQQRVLDRPLTLEVLVHRVDETHAKGARIEIRALTLAGTLAQRILEVGGEERGLPMGLEALIVYFSTAGQVIADKAWVRPVGAHVHPAAPHRHDMQLASPLQGQIEAIGELTGLAILEHRQGDMHAPAQPIQASAGLERQSLVIQRQCQGVLDAANVTDAHHQIGPVEAVILPVLLDTPARRDLKRPLTLLLAWNNRAW